MPRVLVVDDDPVSLLVAGHILSAGGYEVTSVPGPAEARDHLTTAAWDLVVCDYLMPGENGLELLASLHEGGHSPVPPFVLVTGFGDQSELDDSRSDLVAAVLTKPVQSVELLATTAQLIGTPA